MKKATIKTDFCIIGAGSGGLSFAAVAAQMGASVVLVEHKKMGGDCLNNGCIPSKSLIAAANIGDLIKHANHFGWSFSQSKLDFQKVYNHIHQVISSIAPHDSVERFSQLGVKVILEEAKFIDEETIETDSNIIKAKKFVIATGSNPFIPPISGLNTLFFYTNENIFEQTELPEHLIIIGGGPVGIELAQAFYRLGSQVTVLEAFKILPKDDPGIVLKLKNRLIEEGVIIEEDVKISSVEKNKKEIECSIIDSQNNPKTISGSHLLVATGRVPHIQDLNLEAAKIKASKKGIIVDECLKSSNPRVYAIGDCIGGYQFTHMATYQAGLAIRNSIFKLGTKIHTHPIPWVTYTDPELAHVGYLESQLHEKKINYKVLELSFEENDRAQVERRTEGVIKVLVKPNGSILGVTILGLHAGELIYLWVIAIQNRMKISTLAKSIAPYPTLNDINQRVAGSYYTPKIYSPLMKKIVRACLAIFSN